MINNTQLELLESFMGPDGFLIETIMDNPQFDIGTKTLYLARAVRKNCHAYLLDLDKLYDENLKDEAQSNLLELIQSLKRINDLCFNNDIKTGDFGLSKALIYTFSRLGAVNPSEFHLKIVEMIHAKIEELMKTDGQEIKSQQKARRTLEKSIWGPIQWRKTLDLPAEQHAPISSVVDGGLFKARKHSDYRITPTQEQALLAMQISIDNELIPVSMLVGILDTHLIERPDHEGLQLLRRIGAWYYFANIPLECIFSLQATRLMQMVNRVDEVIELVKEAKVSFETIANLSDEKRGLFLKYSQSVKALLLDENYTAEDLVKLPSSELKIVLKNPLSENAATILTKMTEFKY